MKNTKKQKAVAVPSSEFFKMLIASGVNVPDNVSRIIIDAKRGGVVEVHWQTYADDEIVEVGANVLKGIRIDGEEV